MIDMSRGADASRAVLAHCSSWRHRLRSRFSAASLVLFGAAALAGCTSSGFRTTDLREGACLAHAKQTLYDADFAEKLVVIPERDIVSGSHGGYDATVFCKTDAHRVDFEVHGLDPEQADWYRGTIIRKF